ncbi:hypothetical protein [Streptomyces sp. NPDC086777]|uniref:hypothetical protein n=1 Tax=Streptomyces sp. NPDC086777 TaxID=3154866 RepID=UPI003451034B
MRFSNGYYAQLLDSCGKGATEALVDPGSGAVQPEFGPATMWNTSCTLRDNRIVGMVSVNATTGDVWYRTWHGRFLQMQERPTTRGS